MTGQHLCFLIFYYKMLTKTTNKDKWKTHEPPPQRTSDIYSFFFVDNKSCIAHFSGRPPSIKKGTGPNCRLGRKKLVVKVARRTSLERTIVHTVDTGCSWRWWESGCQSNLSSWVPRQK